jgi:hypothetical protein
LCTTHSPSSTALSCSPIALCRAAARPVRKPISTCCSRRSPARRRRYALAIPLPNALRPARRELQLASAILRTAVVDQRSDLMGKRRMPTKILRFLEPLLTLRLYVGCTLVFVASRQFRVSRAGWQASRACFFPDRGEACYDSRYRSIAEPPTSTAKRRSNVIHDRGETPVNNALRGASRRWPNWVPMRPPRPIE